MRYAIVFSGYYTQHGYAAVKALDSQEAYTWLAHQEMHGSGYDLVIGPFSEEAARRQAQEYNDREHGRDRSREQHARYCERCYTQYAPGPEMCPNCGAKGHQIDTVDLV